MTIIKEKSFKLGFDIINNFVLYLVVLLMLIKKLNFN